MNFDFNHVAPLISVPKAQETGLSFSPLRKSTSCGVKEVLNYSSALENLKISPEVPSHLRICFVVCAINSPSLNSVMTLNVNKKVLEAHSETD